MGAKVKKSLRQCKKNGVLVKSLGHRDGDRIEENG
jgi:hypothetical protein